MRTTSLILGTHNHLPLGLGQAGAEELYQESIKPLLSIAYRFPEFPLTLHYSGILLEWQGIRKSWQRHAHQQNQ